MRTENFSSYLVAAHQGRPVGPGISYKVSADRLNGAISLFEGVLPPSAFVDLHTHSHEDECSHILSGHLTFLVGDERIEAGPGSYVLKPREVPHAFWNATQEPARVLEITSPGNLDDYYPQLMALFKSAPQSNGEAVKQLAERYGIRYHLAESVALRQALR